MSKIFPIILVGVILEIVSVCVIFLHQYQHLNLLFFQGTDLNRMRYKKRFLTFPNKSVSFFSHFHFCETTYSNRIDWTEIWSIVKFLSFFFKNNCCKVMYKNPNQIIFFKIVDEWRFTRLSSGRAWIVSMVAKLNNFINWLKETFLN